MIPFTYAPMATKDELIKRYPDDLHPVPVADLVLGDAEPRIYTPHRKPDHYGQILLSDGLQSGLWSPGRFLYKLRNVVVVRDAGWQIMLEDDIAAEESCPFPRQMLGSAGIMPSYKVEFRERIPAVFDAHPWETNHYHRVMDSIPRGWAWSEGLIPRHAIKIHRGMNAVRYDTLYFPSFWPPLGYAPGPVEYVRKHCNELAMPEHDGSFPRAVYFSRTDAGRRRVLNEREIGLFGHATQYQVGAFTVHPRWCSALSFPFQIESARAAKLIIGPHGAAMVNSIFADHATVIEFVPKSYQHPCVQYVSKFAGNRYIRIICEDSGAPNHDMTVDLKQFREALDFAMATA